MSAVAMLRRRLKTLATSAACVAGVLALGYAWRSTLDLAPSFLSLPSVPAVESVSVVVVAGQPDPDRTGRAPASSRDPGADAANPGTVAPDQPVFDEHASDPEPVPPTADGLTPVYPSGYVAGGKVAVAVPRSEESLATVLERQVASLTAGACGDFGSWRPVEPVNVIPDGSCARYRTVIDDEAAEQIVAVADNVVRRDDTPPLPPRLVIVEASENAHAVADTLFYRAVEGEAGTFTVAAVAEDPESGIAQLSFPALGETASTLHAGPRASMSYRWSGSLSTGAPAVGIVMAMNGAGRPSETPIQLVGDADAPAGGFVSYRGGVHREGSVEIAIEPGEDATSGVEAASGVLEEEEARLAGGQCRGAWGGWHAAQPGGSPGRPACVRFRYRVSDNVGNEAIYESSVVAHVIDETPPTVAIMAPEDGATVSGTVALQAEADDTGFGVVAVKFEFNGSGRSRAQWRAIATTAAEPYAATWTTLSLPPGAYYVRALATDRAGNRSASKPVRIQIVEMVTPEPALAPPAEQADDPPTLPPNEAGDADPAGEGIVGGPAVPAEQGRDAAADEEVQSLTASSVS